MRPPSTDRGLRLDGCYDSNRYDPADVEAATIPVERASGPILVVAGDDDHLWPSGEMAARIVQRMTLHHRQGDVVNLTYRGAGHLLVDPADEADDESPEDGFDFGGGPAADRAAAVDAWPRIASFLTDP